MSTDKCEEMSMYDHIKLDRKFLKLLAFKLEMKGKAGSEQYIYQITKRYVFPGETVAKNLEEITGVPARAWRSDPPLILKRKIFKNFPPDRPWSDSFEMLYSKDNTVDALLAMWK